MEKDNRKSSYSEKVKENKEPISPIASPSSRPRNPSHSERSPKPKDGENLRGRLAKSKQVWRKESMEKRPRSGPMVARHSLTKTSNLKLNTEIARNTDSPRGSLRPTSPTYDTSAFKRQVVNRPVSPHVGGASKRLSSTSSFNRGKRPSSPSVATTPEEQFKKRLEKSKKAKLYLLQQAGPHTFIVAGGGSEEHRHKVTIGPQSCSCGKGMYCIHILFVMIRVFQLPENDPFMHSKVLKNFEVETLFRKYESLRKQRLSRGRRTSLCSTSNEAAVSSTSPEYSDTSNKMDVTCPICLLELQGASELIHCEDCHNKLHRGCMAIWYQLVKKQGEKLTCPLCRSVWTSFDSLSFENDEGGGAHTEAYSASPNYLGVSPVSGFPDIEPSTLLPRAQPIPQEHSVVTVPWIEMFGEDLIGCLFMKNEWVMRETALRHLSREIIMLLSHPSEQDITSSSTNQSHQANAENGQSARSSQMSQYQSRIELVLEISCQILAMMMADPVYKVYVSSLRALRTMLSYCTLPDVTKLKVYMKPVIQNIVLKCADGNRKTNQLSISTLCEFAKDQDGELAIGKELNAQGQNGLGGCLYVLDCCVSSDDSDGTQLQWLNGRLLTMNQLLVDHAAKFSVSEVGHNALTELSRQILLPIIEFSVRAINRAGNPPRTIKYSKRVIILCAKYISAIPGMNTKIRQLLSQIEPDLRRRLEKQVINMSVMAQQVALTASENLAESSESPDISEARVGSPPLDAVGNGKTKAKKTLSFGLLYQSTPASRLPRHTALHHRRSNSYTEAVYNEEDEVLDMPPSGAAASRPSLLTADSVESVEADHLDYVSDASDAEAELICNERLKDAEHLQGGEAVADDEADRTLTGPISEDLSDNEYDEVDHPAAGGHKSPKRLSRGRVVSGSKPCISIRSESELDTVDDVDIRSVEISDDQCFDFVDGDPALSAENSGKLAVPRLLLSHESMGFETIDDWHDDAFEPIEPMDHHTDSESGTDHISQSVSISLSSNSTDEEEEGASDGEYRGRDLKPVKESVPFRGYRKHMRSKTDPFKLHRAKSSTKSPRYHSDPAGGDSTTTSSASSTPRTPPVLTSSSKDGSEAPPDDPPEHPPEHPPRQSLVNEATVKPLGRSLTFSEPPAKRQHTFRPKSMRATKVAQVNRSRIPGPRSKTSAAAAPIFADTASASSKLWVSSAGAGLSPPPSPGTQSPRRSSSPIIPAVIRALTPPNSPLRNQSITSSTPNRTPSSSPPAKFTPSPPDSRSASPQSTPATAVVRPQASLLAPAGVVREERVEKSTSVPAQAQVTVADSVEPSRPIQRQTSTSTATSVLGGMIVSSTSGSSDDHKPSGDSFYVEELSDSAIASPYEKPVSFKSEVALFSPRDSSEEGNCHCKDEVELEEAIALARAMEISTDQTALPQVPGLSMRHEQETITIHVQEDQLDGKGGKVEYLEDIHWKRGMMIGTGAFSTCYQCRDVKTGIIMAVKQISFCRNSESEQDSICKAVIEEIKMMATLNHSNIVRILGATQTGAHFNMFVEWMPGGSVSHLLERYGAFSEPVITSYVQQVLIGLAYLHDHHILHRDMKGANLLVDSTGRHLRIGDFGACAQLASSMTGAGELKGQLLGTIAFMAPEVLRGEHYGRACDVWSVGCVIIEMVTTKPPWDASNVSNHLKLIFKIASANASPPIPENLPPGIKDIMLRCLEPESKHRPPAKELLQHPLFTRSSYRRR